MKHHAMTQPFPAVPLHYLDSAEELRLLQAQGYSWADMARMTGLTIPKLTARMQLCGLDEGLRVCLRREGVPEEIALTLVKLPDPVTRRRMAQRIIRERLCIRDAALLVQAAGRKRPNLQPQVPVQRVITVMRDVRLYKNAVRSIAEQMKTAGVRATYSERRTGSMQELTVSYPARRRRMERYHSM